jgi:hypothetical protein
MEMLSHIFKNYLTTGRACNGEANKHTEDSQSRSAWNPNHLCQSFYDDLSPMDLLRRFNPSYGWTTARNSSLLWLNTCENIILVMVESLPGFHDRSDWIAAMVESLPGFNLCSCWIIVRIRSFSWFNHCRDSIFVLVESLSGFNLYSDSIGRYHSIHSRLLSRWVGWMEKAPLFMNILRFL